MGQVPVTAVAEPGDDALGMFFGPAVVVRVVEQACEAEALRVLSQLRGEVAHHQFHGPGVRPQLLGGSPLAEQGPGFIAGEHHGPQGMGMAGVRGAGSGSPG